MYNYVRIYTLVVHIHRDVQYVRFDGFFEVLVVKDQQEHNWGEVAKYGDTKADQQAHEYGRNNDLLEIINAAKHVCRAENDKDGYQGPNLSIKEIFFCQRAVHLIPLLTQSI